MQFLKRDFSLMEEFLTKFICSINSTKYLLNTLNITIVIQEYEIWKKKKKNSNFNKLHSNGKHIHPQGVWSLDEHISHITSFLIGAEFCSLRVSLCATWLCLLGFWLWALTLPFFLFTNGLLLLLSSFLSLLLTFRRLELPRALFCFELPLSLLVQSYWGSLHYTKATPQLFFKKGCCLL